MPPTLQLNPNNWVRDSAHEIDQTPVLRVPQGLQFEVDDIELDWQFSSTFDYIHCRYMNGALKNWPRLMEQTFQYVSLVHQLPYLLNRDCQTP
jgi:hypothetical protein